MVDGLLLLAALAAAYAGFALLALSQSRHWQQVLPGHGQQPPHRRARRWLASLALALSLATCVVRDGVVFGVVLWLLQLSVAAPLLAFTLSWRPLWLQRLARSPWPQRRSHASPSTLDSAPATASSRRHSSTSQPFTSQPPAQKDADRRECEQDPEPGRAAGIRRRTGAGRDRRRRPG
ncbi:MAG: DUF3325 domain-containing protein [Gammaproteobacteria bacterium]|nr:DUF3325 domain-containing protein [Gammaproteobacteria bacterium]